MWNFGFIPVIGYNTDIGFKYGGLVAAYDYGNGENYPKYRKMIRLEISRCTKGSGINQLFLDFNPLFKRDDIRLTADISYLSDQTSDFYGFNGALCTVEPGWLLHETFHNADFGRAFSHQDGKFGAYVGINWLF